MNRIVIEAARAEDADHIRAFAESVIRTTFAGDLALQDDTVANVNLNVDKWLLDPAQCVHLKAMQGEAIVGMVLLREFWNLCNLFVAPSHQGMGVGKALLEAACAPCAGRSPRGAILLNAAPNAIGFYRKLGFVERAPARPLPPGALAMQRPV